MNKKILLIPIAIALAVIISLTAAALVVSRFSGNESTAVPLRIGDLDLNGESNIIDLVMLKKYLVSLRELDAVQCKQADYNSDGFVDGLDLSELRRALICEEEYGDNAVSLTELYKGTTYYVSADGTSLDGTSILAPMSLETANTKTYSTADRVLFKSGDTFYGTIELNVSFDETSKIKNLTVSSYGEGPRPVISGGAVVSDEKSFKANVENYLYTIDLSNTALFSRGYLTGEGIKNIGFITDGVNVYGDRKKDISELSKQYDFYINEKNILYVICSQNPVKALGEVILATDNVLMKAHSNTAVSGLRFTHTGAHAIIGAGDTTVSNVIISDNIIENVGGSLQYILDGNFVRYGNGIEFYNKTVEGVRVEGNIIRGCYDVGFTVQGNNAACSAKDVQISGNVFYANKQSNEIFIENAKSTGITNYSFTENLCIASGYTWGNFTSNPKNGVPCEFLFYNYYPSVLDMNISNNTIIDCLRLYWWSVDDTALFKSGVKSSNNSLFVKSSAFSFKDAGTLEQLQSLYSKEIGSEYTEITGAGDYSALKTAAVSDDISEIFAAADNFTSKFNK